MPQVKNELAEKELIKKFRHDNSWLSELTPKQNWVNNDVIKIPRQGADPEVLINNTIYPIAVHNHQDDFIPVSLNKYETENESVTDDELYALPYEKVNTTQEKHRLTLEDKVSAHALHSLAVPAASGTLPVLETTGPDDGTGRRRLITADLINYRRVLSDLNVPLIGRVGVLSNEHVTDLMIEDSQRAKAWGGDFQLGIAGVMHCGFKLWASNYQPKYDLVGGVWTRQGFESATGRDGSVFFYKPNACKARGSVKRYWRLAENDPENRETVLGFRLYFIAVGIKDQGFGALVSADVV